MGFSRKEYWSGLPCPPPEDLADPGIGPMSLTSLASAGGFFPTSTTWEALLAGDRNFTKEGHEVSSWRRGAQCVWSGRELFLWRRARYNQHAFAEKRFSEQAGEPVVCADW